jgi:hypothetical protein
MLLRIIRVAVPWVLLILFTCSSAATQDAPPRVEVFAEGGASFLNNGTGQITIPCPVCTGPACPLVVCLRQSASVRSSFSKTGRLFTGGRLRFTRHDALEASYSFSPNHFSLNCVSCQEGTQSLGSAYNRLNLVSFNYVRYLWVRTALNPFVTAGVGTNRFSGPASASAVLSGLVGADNGWQFAWNYGGGADLVLQRHLALRLELRDYVSGQPSVINGTSHNLVPSAGIVFRLK